jgi:methylenetetrahydrofolate dehydrogenase (NADP+)/methenyltetrahydrofolate cyclohydrolase
MSARIINGKEIAQSFRLEMKEEIAQLTTKGIIPGLAVIIVGENPASVSYVKAKIKACEEIGMYSTATRLPLETTEEELLKHIRQLNQNPEIHGILVQLPLPNHIAEKAVIDAIAPEKDVDGFHPINVGNMLIGDRCFLPCTPHGIIKMIQSTGTEISGKNVVVVGRSNIVGKPVSMLLLQKNATVTICHSRTENLAEQTKKADILVVAIGKAGMIGKEHVSPGTLVIDVGVNRGDDGKLVGDVLFEEVKEVASYITPVPGGVGPMTITMLLFNTLESAKQFHNIGTLT